MDRLNTLRLFVRLAELQSFSATAAELDISASAVSKAIADLEKALGARLVQRTTRRVALTEAGQRYAERAQGLLQAMDEADAEASNAAAAASGRLRLNIPMALGLTDLGEALTAFAVAHPRIELDVELADRHVDLLAEGFDLGLRATTDPKDSSYTAQRIASFALHVCASPAYVRQHGRPATPAELGAHACFTYTYASAGARWPLHWDGASHVSVTPRGRANNTMFLKRLVLANQGIAVLPDFVARPEIDSGSLIVLFPHVARSTLVLFAVVPERRLVPGKVSACVAFLKAWFAARSSASA